MTRILLRAPTSPSEVPAPPTVVRRNLIGGNTGNLIFLHTTHRLLSTDQAEIDVDRLRVEPRLADRISEAYDHYVVPFANAFRPSFEPQLIRWTALIKRLRIPVVVLGVGAQSNIDYHLEPMRRLDATVKAFVAAVLDHGPSLGVRGEYTDHYLRSLGFRDIEVIGCPSMFIDGPFLDVAKRVEALELTSRIAINGSVYRPQMGSIIERSASRFPNLVYVAQKVEEVAWLTYGGSARTPPAPGFPDGASHPLVAAGRVRAFTHPWPWIRFLAGMDFVFGSRIHGNLAGLIAGTPSFVLAHDSRTLELARYFEIPHLRLADVDPDVDARRLYEAADYGPLTAGHAARWAAFAGYLARHGISTAFDGGRPEAVDASHERFDAAVLDGSPGALRRPKIATERRRLSRRFTRAPVGRQLRRLLARVRSAR